MIHFIIPLFNKGTHSKEVIGTVARFLKERVSEPYELVLCDDGSTDDTLASAREAAAGDARIRVIGYKDNRGRGYAVKFAGGTCAGDYLIYFDLDFPLTSDLSRLLEMTEYVKKYDVVIGSRFLSDSRTNRFPLRALISRVYRYLLRIVMPDLNVADIDVGFKGFRTRCFKEINALSRIDGWSWDLECLSIAQSKGMSIKEFPIDWNERYNGHSSAVRIFRDSLEEFCGMLDVRMRSFGKFRT